MENVVFVIDRTQYLIGDFFKDLYSDCEVDDDCILTLNGIEYEIVLCTVMGMDLGDIQLYKLEVCLDTIN